MAAAVAAAVDKCCVLASRRRSGDVTQLVDISLVVAAAAVAGRTDMDADGTAGWDRCSDAGRLVGIVANIALDLVGVAAADSY